MTRVQRLIISAYVVFAAMIVLFDLGLANWQTLTWGLILFAVSAVKWETIVAEGNVMTDTELSALANNAVSPVSSAYDNSSKRDQYFILELNVDFVSAPSAGGYVNVYAAIAPDGTNYGSSSTVAADVGQFWLVTSIFVPAITAAIRVHSRIVVLPPTLIKFALENKSGQVFPTTASTTLKLYSVNDESQ